MDRQSPKLRNGYTTGTCATAATAAALQLLINNTSEEIVSIILPTNDSAELDIINSYTAGDSATASVMKDAGDDPDITNGAIINSTVKINDTGKISFFAGKGVGTITKAGLQLAVGEAAINPVPRKMMEKVAKEITDQGIDIIISVVDGEKLATKTFNPRLGITGGISIIGTSGIVRPFSHEAIQETVRCNINVATANHNKNKQLVFVAGHYGMKAAMTFFNISEEEIIEVSNEWDTALQHAKKCGAQDILVLSHPGKLAKFIDGYFNTHSSKSPSALPIVQRIAAESMITLDFHSTTVDGIFQKLSPSDSYKLAKILANNICAAIIKKYGLTVSVTLINMQNSELATAGEINKWQRK